MVEVSHVAQPATPSLKQHPYPAEEVILVAPVITKLNKHQNPHTNTPPNIQKPVTCSDSRERKYSNVKSGASTSGQLAEQKQIKKWMDLKTTDTKGKAPAMGRAGGPEDLPLNLQQFITLNITLHSDEPP
ncbi:hypothetical protein Tsp_10461 [Trichinella spiralis]|uniref:hypothetical protein n=1 Tax=Trichinella spiralis TaxID=6334 RepID=UPI0001EFE27E|nr:putative mRNA cap guanine-N7 methyltransferase [Trichinella spiralis]XP_003372905.1 hypothetical protein Tsp_10461 [Trichinella spiralis]